LTVVHGPLYQPVAARYRQQGAALKTLRDANCRDEHTRCCHWNRDLHNRTLPFAFSRPEAGWSQPPTSALRRGERRYAHPRFTTGCRVGQPIHILWYETQQVNTIHAPRKNPGPEGGLIPLHYSFSVPCRRMTGAPVGAHAVLGLSCAVKCRRNGA